MVAASGSGYGGSVVDKNFFVTTVMVFYLVLFRLFWYFGIVYFNSIVKSVLPLTAFPAEAPCPRVGRGTKIGAHKKLVLSFAEISRVI